MRVTSGKVVSGQIVAEGEPLPDGSVVTILARDVDESFELDATAEAELLLSLAEADRGELISADTINRAVDEIGDQTDEFVVAAARRVLEKSEW